MNNEQPDWLKAKGYLHITAAIDVRRRRFEIIRKVTNPTYVARYAFYPLIHATINERRYKRVDSVTGKRAHSYMDENGEHKHNAKSRPLHYATHMDAIIFGYYADHLQQKYEIELRKFQGLSDCIVAYRKIPIENEETNKSTIHFAHEVFEEIRRRGEVNDCGVLTFDIKSFFSSLDHQKLKKIWASLLEVDKLPDDHYNVFKAATRFSYILKDDLRKYPNKKGRKSEFDEKELARIRNKHGINAFFESPKAFRERIKDGSLKLHKYPFHNKDNKPMGIPQGLPISAVLANLYLLEFDKKILDTVVNQMGGYYKRYSDDIVIVCAPSQMDVIRNFVESTIEESKVTISKDKTEKFIFRKIAFGKKEPRLTSIKISNDQENISAPLVYLGFEFNGQKTLIKSANLAKFYRRMISSVKRKAKRAIKIAEQNPGTKPVIFRRQLYKLYMTKGKGKIHRRWKKLVKNELGEYRLVTGEKTKQMRSNYLTYATRASETMQEPAILHQIRNHKKIFNQAVQRHLKKN